MKYKSPVYSMASGSIAGIVYSHNWAGKYTRERVVPTNPNSQFQVLVRDAMSWLTSRWKNTLTAGQRELWKVYADQVPLIDKLGDPIYVTALNHYIRSNVERKVLALALFDDAPTTYNLGSLTTPTASGFAPGPPSTCNVTYSTADDWYASPLSRLFIYVSRPMLTSIGYFRGPYRYAGSTVGGTPPPLQVTFPWPAVAGQRVYFRATASTGDGRRSAETFFLLNC